MGRPNRRQFTPQQKQVQAGAIDALSGQRQAPDAAAEARIGELERALGRKTLECEILGEASRRLG